MNGRLLTPIIEAPPPQRFDIYWVKAYAARDAVIVTGKVRRPLGRTMPVSGHLHLIASFGDGQPKAIADTRWGPIGSRQRSGSFSARMITTDATSLRRIRIEYRPGPACAVNPRASAAHRLPRP
ncbi:hypothetical protein DAH87_10310 [Sphingomonas koreensis]|nr:hypothetical protein DAH52_11965 [Sphingomonas koreensis]RSV06503.1 hypothetical protein CA240_10500 [Sphingomonas koreensis]RSX03955.1 hypothetical protein CA227_23220 [Sphingomonas koreensis]RSX96073.1 hypothetical protein DAH87_10310 [Sphingomonas koreensis]